MTYFCDDVIGQQSILNFKPSFFGKLGLRMYTHSPHLEAERILLLPCSTCRPNPIALKALPLNCFSLHPLSPQRLTDALHGVAAGSTVREDQNCTLEAGSHVMQQSEGLLKEVKSAVDVPNQPNKKLRLAQVRLYSLHEPLLRYTLYSLHEPLLRYTLYSLHEALLRYTLYSLHEPLLRYTYVRT